LRIVLLDRLIPMVARLSIIACFLTLEIAAREWIVRIKEFQDPATMTTRL
jgi:hypothetical protein